MTSAVGSVVRHYGRCLMIVACLAAGSTVISACDGGRSKTLGAAASHAYRIPQTSVSQAVIDYLMPTNGAEAAIGLNDVGNFETAVSTKAADSCLAADGFPPAPQQPPAGLTGVQGLPNLAYISAHPVFQVGRVHINDPTKGMSAAEKRAYAHALKRCTPTIVAVLGSKQANRLWSSWMIGVLPEVSGSSAVRAANRAGAACSRSTAFPASSFTAALQKVYAAAGKYYGNPRLPNKRAISEGNRVEAHGTPVFLRCFGPAVRTLDRLLAQRAKSFLARNALVIRQLQNQLARQLTALSAKYDVPLSTGKLYTGR